MSGSRERLGGQRLNERDNFVARSRYAGRLCRAIIITVTVAGGCILLGGSCNNSFELLLVFSRFYMLPDRPFLTLNDTIHDAERRWHLNGGGLWANYFVLQEPGFLARSTSEKWPQLRAKPRARLRAITDCAFCGCVGAHYREQAHDRRSS
jgi:hypothetical protein